METIFEPTPVSFHEQRKRDFEARYTEVQIKKIAMCPRHRNHMPPENPEDGVKLCHTANSRGEYSMFAPPCDETTCPMGREEKAAREEEMRVWKITSWLHEHVLNAACASVEDLRYHWMERASRETVQFRDEIRDFLIQMTDEQVRGFQFD